MSETCSGIMAHWYQGSGKTTLMEHILKSPDHGLRIAVIVNDMSRYETLMLQQHMLSD